MINIKKNTIKLTELEKNKTAIIVELKGGTIFQKKLESMGVRPGLKITMISGQFLNGPITIKVNATKLGIGFNMAQKIIVEANK